MIGGQAKPQTQTVCLAANAADRAAIVKNKWRVAGLPENEMKRRVSVPLSWFLCLSLVGGVFSPALYASTRPLSGIPIQGTPFDGKLMRTGILDISADEMMFTGRTSLEELF